MTVLHDYFKILELSTTYSVPTKLSITIVSLSPVVMSHRVSHTPCRRVERRA